MNQRTFKTIEMVIKVIEVLGGQKNLNMIINYYKNIGNILLDFAEYIG